MSGAGGTILFLFLWNPSMLFSRGRGEVASPVAMLSSAGYLRTGRVAHEHVRVASGCSCGICPRASAARNFSIGMVRASPRCLQAAGAGSKRLLPGPGGIRTRQVVPPSLPLPRQVGGGGPGERQRPGLEGPLPAEQPLHRAGGAPAPRWLRVRFLLCISSRNFALPSVLRQGIVALVLL